MTDFQEPPCRDCEYRDLPKTGKFISADGLMTTTNHKYMDNRELKLNPCHWSVCKRPQAYADYIAGLFIQSPTQPGDVVSHARIR